MAVSTGAQGLGQFRLFAGMSAEELTWIGDLFEAEDLLTGKVLFEQDAVPDALYFVQSGEVAEIGLDLADPKAPRITLSRVAEAGDLVGRRAVVDDTHHLTTARVRQRASLSKISTLNLEILFSKFPALRGRLRYSDVASRLKTIPLFASLDPDQLVQAVDLVRVVKYEAGEMIYRQDDLADAMYVIDTGQVVQSSTRLAPGPVPDIPARRDCLAAGRFFGSEGLVEGAARLVTTKAVTPVWLFRMNREALIWLRRLQRDFAETGGQTNLAGRLGGTSVFGELQEEELEQLAGFTGLVHYGAKQVVFRQGETDQKLYVLDKGTAVRYSTDPEGKEQPREQVALGEALGERSLFLGEPHSITVETTTPSDWLFLARDDLTRYRQEYPQAAKRLKTKQVVKERQRLKRYAWLDDDESLLFQQRRHWFAVVVRAMSPLLMALLGGVITVVRSKELNVLLNIVGGIVLFISFAWLAWVLADWLNDHYIVTTKRVAHVERVVFISESRDEAPLDKVQDANTERLLLGNLLGFGTLTVDTAAAYGAARLKFNYLAHPERMREQIFEEMGRVRAGARVGVRQAIRDKLAAQMGVSSRPNVPPVATMPLTLEATAAGAGSASRKKPPWWNPLWTEFRLPNQVTWRKHWIRLLARVWQPSLAIVALVAAAGLVLGAGGGASAPLAAVLAVLALPVGVWWWWGYKNWSNDRYIATNDRLIDLEKLPLGLRTKQSVTTFDKIQNVSLYIPNTLATILDFGTVIIRTAGAEGALTFPFLRHPSKIQAEIFHRLTAYDEARRRRDREERWEDLPDWFSTYEELKE